MPSLSPTSTQVLCPPQPPTCPVCPALPLCLCRNVSFEENTASITEGESLKSKGWIRIHLWNGVSCQGLNTTILNYSSLTNALAERELGWDTWGNLQAARGQIILSQCQHISIEAAEVCLDCGILKLCTLIQPIDISEVCLGYDDQQ